MLKFSSRKLLEPEILITAITTFAALGTAIAALTNALHAHRELRMRLRPWIGISEWTTSDIRATSASGPYYQAGVVIKNFGNLPAFDVGITCSILSNKERHETVRRRGLLLWPGQIENLEWSISPPISIEAVIPIEIIIDYKVMPDAKTQASTRQIRQFFTGSMKFVDAEEGQSFAK